MPVTTTNNSNNISWGSRSNTVNADFDNRATIMLAEYQINRAPESVLRNENWIPDYEIRP